MSGSYRRQYDVDLVFCIDVTGGMYHLISIFRDNALNLYRDVRACMEGKGKRIGTLRVRIIAFRDYRANGADAMLTTNFFPLPAEADQFKKCFDYLIPMGSGDEREDGLEALAYAIRSEWNTNGICPRHIIVLLTDNDAHDLGHGKNSAYYPRGMARDLGELTAWWGNESDPGFMDQVAKRLILFAPDMPAWRTISANWDKVLHYATEDERNLLEFEYRLMTSIIAQAL